MDIKQVISELSWNQATITSLPHFILSLIFAAILGTLLGQVYIHFGQSLSNRKQFARNFLFVTVTTTLIIGIVKSSIALSLGLVGAHSLVRFRGAIKEPEELAFLFLAISTGLGLGAGQALLTVVALVIIVACIAVRRLVRGKSDQPNLFLTVTSSAPGKLNPSQILEALTSSGATASLKRFDESADQTEASFLVDFKNVKVLEKFKIRLQQLSPDVRVSCLDNYGIAS
jgi:hypothetical protein